MSDRDELRKKMPAIAAFVDALSAEFGEAAIWPQVEKGFAGEPTFFAIEGGTRIGRRRTGHVCEVYRDQYDVSRLRRSQWMNDAQVLAARLGIEIREASADDIAGLEREAEELRKMIANLKGGAK